MIRFHHDFESKSRLSLPTVGTSRYSRDPSTKPLMLAYAFNDEAVQQWVPAEGQPMPKDVRDAMRDPEVTKFAWNKPMEWSMWANTLGMATPHGEWRDPMILAYSLALPGSLAAAGAAVGIPEDKAKGKRGKALIREFCMPRKPTKAKPWDWGDWKNSPDAWEEFKEYNRQDVVAERSIYKRLRRWNMRAEEWEMYAFDQEINEAGIPINMAVVDNARVITRKVIQRRLTRMKEITGLANPNSGPQLLPWLQERGYRFADLKKGHIETADKEAKETDEQFVSLLGTDQLSEDYKEVLSLRAEVSKASVKKYNALAEATDREEEIDRFGVLRNAFQFNGAGRTGRWAGRKFQAQNLAKPAKSLENTQAEAVRDLELLDHDQIEWLYPKPMDLLSTCVRPVVQAPEGYTFADADLTAIENVGLGWLCGDEKILEVFRNGRDPYLDFARYMFQRTYADLKAEFESGKKGPRTVSKPAVLGCGYRLGGGSVKEDPKSGEMVADGLLGYAWNMGIMLTPEQASESVKVWRATYTDVVEAWDAIEVAAKRCIQSGKPQVWRSVRFEMSGIFLRMILPSGRALSYCRPKIEDKATPWGAIKPTITYEGTVKNRWCRIKTHGGKLIENAVQALACDLLRFGLMQCKKEGLDVRLHVHDQILVLCRLRESNWALATLMDCMKARPPWARDIPVSCAGFLSPIFVKD